MPPTQGISWTTRCSCRTCLSGTGGTETPSPSGDPSPVLWGFPGGVWGVLGAPLSRVPPPGSCVPAPATARRLTRAGSPGGSTASTSSPRYWEHWESTGEPWGGRGAHRVPPTEGGDVRGDGGRARHGERGAAGRVPGAPEGDFLRAGAPLSVRGIWGGSPRSVGPLKSFLTIPPLDPTASWTCPRRSWGSLPTASSTSRPGCPDGANSGR